MDTLKELNKIICETFDDDDITVCDETTADQVNGWDSLSHVNLIVMVEKRFKIKFDTKELLKFKNVGDLRRSIESKLADVK